mgnify:CR=1 FL=1
MENEKHTSRNILRWPEVRRRTGRSRTQVWRDTRVGLFPSPVKLGPHAIGWFEDEIADWQRSRQRAVAPNDRS